MPWKCAYDPRAAMELAEIKDKAERRAILNVVTKLQALGPALRFPHQSNVEGDVTGVRELRPRQGNSAHRPLYRRFGDWFLILAIAHKNDYAGQATVAALRGAEYEDR